MATQKFTVKQIIDALTKTRGTITLAAENLGCHDTTVRNYMKRYKSVRDVIEHFSEKIVDVAELKFWEAIQNGEPWAVAMALKTKGKNRGYVERTESDNKHEVIIHDYIVDIGKDGKDIDTPPLRDGGTAEVLE